MKKTIPYSRLLVLVSSILLLFVTAGGLFMAISGNLMWVHMLNSDYSVGVSGYHLDLKNSTTSAMNKHANEFFKGLKNSTANEMIKNSRIYTEFLILDTKNSVATSYDGLLARRNTYNPNQREISGIVSNLVVQETSSEVAAKEKIEIKDWMITNRICRINSETLWLMANVMLANNEIRIAALKLSEKSLVQNFIKPSCNVFLNFSDLGLEVLTKNDERIFSTNGDKPFGHPVVAENGLDGILSSYKIKVYGRQKFIKSLNNTEVVLLIVLSGILVVALFSIIVYLYWHGRKSENSFKLQNDWTMNLAHSLLGPIHSIGISVDALENSADNQRAAFYPLIRESLQKIENQSRKFLRLARAQICPLKPSIRIFKTKDLVTKIYDGVANDALFIGRTEIKLSENSIIKADEAILKDAIEELFNNALKYSPKDSRLIIETTRADGKVHISVIDSGVGISKSEMDRVGEPFFRSEEAVNKGFPGTGLGLYLCKKACETMGAQVTLFSEGKNKGTKATVSFAEIVE